MNVSFLIYLHENMIFPSQSLKPLGCIIAKKLLRPCSSSFHESVSFTGSVYVQLELLNWEDKCGFKLFQPLMFRQFIGLFGLIFVFIPLGFSEEDHPVLKWGANYSLQYVDEADALLPNNVETADVFRDCVFIKTLCVMFLQFSFLLTVNAAIKVVHKSLFYIVVSAAFQPSMWELLCSLICCSISQGCIAINGMQAICEPFQVIYIQAFMVSYVELALATLTFYAGDHWKGITSFWKYARTSDEGFPRERDYPLMLHLNQVRHTDPGPNTHISSCFIHTKCQICDEECIL